MLTLSIAGVGVGGGGGGDGGGGGGGGDIISCNVLCNFSGQTFQWVYFRLFIHWEVVLLPQSNFKATQTSLGLTDQPTFQIPI